MVRLLYKRRCPTKSKHEFIALSYPNYITSGVFAITEDHDRHLYFSSYGNGLFVYHKETKQFTQYKSTEKIHLHIVMTNCQTIGLTASIATVKDWFGLDTSKE